MTKEEKQMRDFISAEIMNRDFGQEQLDKLAEVLYPHDGTNESIHNATRKFSTDIITWAGKKQKQEADKTPKLMTDAEIEELAALM